MPGPVRCCLIVWLIACSAAHAQGGPNGRFGRDVQTPARAFPANPQSQTADGYFQPAQLIAIVDGEPVLAGDLLGQINQMLAPYEGKAPPEEIQKQRMVLMRQMLPVVIETKLAYLDYIQNIPSERISEVNKQLEKKFYELRLESLLKQANVANEAELDAMLRRFGASVAKQKRIFIEQFLAHQKLRTEVDFDPEVTHDEMVDYYRKHLDDYSIEAKAQWEKLTVRFDKYPNKSQAYAALAAMGNEVLRGAPFKAVAQRQSQGLNARDGGYHDWTNRGSLASKVLDESIFSLPVGKLSGILEDEQGFHIVRVIQRQEKDRVSFVKAQVEIKQKIQQQKVKVAREAYVARLRKSAPVWTIFDEQGFTLQAEGKQPNRR